VRRAFREACSPFRGARLLVAVSGGADSTALLVTLARLASELKLELRAAHLDHRLRGSQSRADRAFVAELCRRLGVPLIAAAWDTRRRMRTRGLAGQDGLRRLRREFLAHAARRAGAAAIATAHTADDQLETVLMRLGRGAGLGIGGMSARQGRWIRPFLHATRHEIEADLLAAGIAWREDASNDDPAYLRARIRLGVVPALLEALAPETLQGPDLGRRAGMQRAALARRVARTALEARAARRIVIRQARGLLSRVARIQAGEIALDSAKWRSYPYAIRRSLLGLLWKRLGPVPSGLTGVHLGALEALATSERGDGRIELPGGRVAERDGATLTLRVGRSAHRALIDPEAVPRARRFRLTGVTGGWTTGAMARRRLRSGQEGREFFAAEALEAPLQLRPAGVDETFVPFGRLRARRLGEFLGHQRIPRTARGRPLVLADRRGILAVIGVRRSARAPLTSATRRVLWIQAERHDR